MNKYFPRKSLLFKAANSMVWQISAFWYKMEFTKCSTETSNEVYNTGYVLHM